MIDLVIKLELISDSTRDYGPWASGCTPARSNFPRTNAGRSVDRTRFRQ